MQHSTDFNTGSFNPLINFLSGKKFRWLRHLLFICIALILAFKGDIGMPDDKRPQELVNAILLVDAATFLFIMGAIYLLVYVVVPKFLFRSRIIVFAILF